MQTGHKKQAQAEQVLRSSYRSVTYISGCSDSPERIREVNEINKAKREKEAAAERKEQIEIAYKKQSIAEALTNHTFDTSMFTYTTTPEVMASAVAAYENNIMGATGILQ